MRLSGLSEFDAVVAVARHRSFRAAATELEMSASALSATVAALEARIGVRLFNRTTRSVALTEAGLQFVTAVTPALAKIRDAMNQAGDFRSTPHGTLRINSSVGAARQAMQLFIEYMLRYPDMKLDIVTEGRLIDIVTEGFDAGIRLAESVPQDMIAVPFGPRQGFKVVGSPGYFADNPKPQRPSDLAAHRCIRMRLPSGNIYRWEFQENGQIFEIDTPGALTLDEPWLIREAARAGLGLAYMNDWNIADDIATGRLVAVLEDYAPSFEGLCLYYPGRRHVQAGLRALIDLIREKR